MNSRHNLTKSKSKFSEMLHRQCKVNGKLKTCKRHSLCLCIGDGDAALPKNFTLCEIVAWFCRQFVSKLDFSLGCLYCRIVFNLQPPVRVSTDSLCTLFQCVLCLSGIALRPVLLLDYICRAQLAATKWKRGPNEYCKFVITPRPPHPPHPLALTMSIMSMLVSCV